MADAANDSLEISTPGLLTTAAYTERDLAQGVTRWLLSNFGHELNDAVRSTVFTPALLCAIACREAGMYWLPLTPHRTAAEILGICVYDASGDVAGASRSAFPVNTSQFRLAYGDAFTAMLIGEANKARAARGLGPASIVYKGYGIFQYDLQFVRTDESFFKSKQWYSFTECVTRAVRELKEKYESTGDIQRAVQAYNGSGPRAERYARDVMRFLPFCEEAADQPPAVAATVSSARRGDEVVGIAAAMPAAGDDDPAAPANDSEINETADLSTARVQANLGTTEEPEPSPPLAPQAVPPGAPIPLFDFARAQEFLDACRNSNPRVTYGLGAKVPFHGAVPGRDFTRIDCSGFVREAIRLATNPSIPFPDGSVVQHDWVRGHGFEKSSVAAGTSNDGAVRIAFLRPQDVPSGIGHVALVCRGKTLESHGGVGPDARTWDGKLWQAKTFVYVLAPAQQVTTVFEAPSIAASLAQATAFTVHHGRRYRATVVLSGFEVFASNDYIAGMLQRYGFTQISVTGSGSTRQAEALWPRADTTAPLDPHLRDVKELPVAVAASLSLQPAAPIATDSPTLAGQGVVSSNVFSSGSIPTHHDGLLIVKMRQAPVAAGLAPLSRTISAASQSDLTTGLSALAFYERAGLIKRVIPLRRDTQPAAAGVSMSALSAIAESASDPNGADEAHSGVSFIELERGHNAQQLQAALANDPYVVTAAQVPIRYLAARPPSRKTTQEGGPGPGIGIAAVPPQIQIMWNLAKISWQEARNQPGFRDADEIRVAVLDTGVDQTHPELQNQIQEYHWQQSADVLRPVSDKDIVGHGTHVSGTIAALIGGSVGSRAYASARCRSGRFLTMRLHMCPASARSSIW